MSGSLLRRQLERARSEPLASLESYALLMAAVSLVHRLAPADFERARLILEHLIDRNRHHPSPHAWLAKWHVLRVQQGWSQDIKREAALAHPRSPTAPYITASMGIASLVPRPGTSSDTLVHAADAALYRAKYGGRNRFEVFTPPQ